MCEDVIYGNKAHASWTDARCNFAVDATPVAVPGCAAEYAVDYDPLPNGGGHHMQNSLVNRCFPQKRPRNLMHRAAFHKFFDVGGYRP